MYYNNKFFDGTRNEMRITSWGGSKSPLQDHENTGAIVVLAFCKNEDCDSKLIDVWVCRSLEEENFIETLTGELLPGLSIFTDANKVI
ncbi:restriction endonuclease, partial [Vibrio parahaemolyticus]